jgi:hypothetical protein
MGSTSPLSPLFSYMLILMRIGPMILQTIASPLVIVPTWHLSYLFGEVRNSLLLLDLAARQNIVL